MFIPHCREITCTVNGPLQLFHTTASQYACPFGSRSTGRWSPGHRSLFASFALIRRACHAANTERVLVLASASLPFHFVSVYFSLFHFHNREVSGHSGQSSLVMSPCQLVGQSTSTSTPASSLCAVPHPDPPCLGAAPSLTIQLGVASSSNKTIIFFQSSVFLKDFLCSPIKTQGGVSPVSNCSSRTPSIITTIDKVVLQCFFHQSKRSVRLSGHSHHLRLLIAATPHVEVGTQLLPQLHSFLFSYFFFLGGWELSQSAYRQQPSILTTSPPPM
jgi:hypothetical protein